MPVLILCGLVTDIIRLADYLLGHLEVALKDHDPHRHAGGNAAGLKRTFYDIGVYCVRILFQNDNFIFFFHNQFFMKTLIHLSIKPDSLDSPGIERFLIAVGILKVSGIITGEIVITAEVCPGAHIDVVMIGRIKHRING